MSERRVIERIEAVDRALARREIASEASEQIRQQLARRAAARPFHARLRWWPALAFAAGATLMALLLIRGERGRGREQVEREHAVERAAEPESGAGEGVITSPRCAAFEPGPHRLALGECVRGSGIEVAARLPSTIVRTGDRVEVIEGEVAFDVESRPEQPLHVIAGATDIEVVGTRFIVHQREGVGWIVMTEGRVRVREGEGPGVTLDRDQRLDWTPARAEPEPDVVTPSRARQRKVDAGDEGIAALLDEVASLRRAGQFEAAVDRLRAADTRGWSERSRQLVSYEIGTLLERQLDDAPAACEHWRAHQHEFPNGRHAAIVERSLARLGCDAP
ncbi:FecR domain-containing protein [Nannocystaceae bacterium ST9]